jgi:hypothetical protein
LQFSKAAAIFPRLFCFVGAKKMAAYIDDICQAARLLQQSERIMVIGCSGAGKSTLSRKISQRLDLPYFSMDKEFFWLPGWVKRSKDEERRLIAEVVAGGRWLMDGTGPSTFDLRVPRTQLVLWVRMPRWLCLSGSANAHSFISARPGPTWHPDAWSASRTESS